MARQELQKEPDALREIHLSFKAPLPDPAEVGVTEALHFMAIKDNQVVLSSRPDPLDSRKGLKKILRLYQHLSSTALRYRALSGPCAAPKGGGKTPEIIWRVSSSLAVLCWLSPDLEVFCSFPPMTHQSTAVAAVVALEQWLRKNEETLFLKRLGAL